MMSSYLVASRPPRTPEPAAARPASVLVAMLAAVAMLGAQAPARTAGDARAPATSEIVARDLRAHVTFLASDELRGRGVGDEGNEVAVRYGAAAFEGAGLRPTAGDFTQAVDLYALSLGPDSSLAVQYTAGAADVRTRYEVGEHFHPAPATGHGTVTAALVFVGYGITALELGYDDYAGVDVRNKIAVALRHEPQEHDENSRFSGRATTDHATFERKARTAREHGAVGLIVVPDIVNHPDQARLDELRRFWPERPSVRSREFVLADAFDRTSIPVAMMSVPAADRMLAAAGVEPSSVAALQRQLEERISEAGAAARAPSSFPIEDVRITLSIDLDRQHTVAHNVLGYLEGGDPARRDELVVVGAHLDHDGLDAESRVYNGADDDASGTAAVLEIAEAMAAAAEAGAPPARTVVFALWNAEEKGLLGSRYFVEHPVPAGRVVANINLDMVGRNEEIPADAGARFRGLSPTTAEASANVVHLLGYSYSPDLARMVERANEAIGFTIVQRYDDHEQNLIRRSDQWPFLERGIPAAFFTTGLHPDYHTPADDVAKIDFEKLERVARLAYRVAWEVATADAPPRFVEPDPKPTAP